MAFNWRDYFDLSVELKNQAGDPSSQVVEALHRALISRAYYSAFNVALKYAITLGYNYPFITQPKQLTTHEDLIAYFNSRPRENPDYLTISMRLDTCRKQRVIADYKEDFDNSFNTLDDRSEMVIAKAKDVLDITPV